VSALRRGVVLGATVSLAVAAVLSGGAAALADPAPVLVSTWSELTTAFTAATGSETISLTTDISSPFPATPKLIVPAGASITLDLAGYHLTAVEGVEGAGIGVSTGTSLTVEDTVGGGILTATGGEYSAGIGGDYAGSGTVTIDSGTVDATGGVGGAGIGGGSGGDNGTVVINGGAVSGTTGTNGGAGIGGGVGGAGGTITINGGTVTATDGTSYIGAALGGGWHGAGGDVTIGSGAHVTAIGTPSVGAGVSGIGFGTLAVSGTLTIPTGSTLAIPAGTTITGTGTLGGAGSITNDGAILHTVAVDSALEVTDNSFSLSFDAEGGSPDPATRTVYAENLDASGDTLPTPTRAGYTLTGWFTAATGGTQWATTDALTDGLTLYAQWVVGAATTPGSGSDSGSGSSSGSGSGSGSGTLAFTGANVSPVVPATGLLAVVLGLALLVLARLRRRRADTR
jgi:uncharacterized repeat protein (TIGR02543 family)